MTINAPENTVNWQVNLTEHFSVSNLYFVNNGQANRVSLAAAERNSATDPLRFTVKCDHPFTLRVHAAGVTKDFQIEAGEHTFLLGDAEPQEEKCASLSVKALSVDGTCPITKAQIENAIDFVYFTNEGSGLLSSYAVNAKGDGIFNLSTIGRPTPGVKVEGKGALSAIGYEQSVSLSRSHYAAGNEGFMLCAKASTDTRVVRMLVTVGKGAKGILTASLSDASAPAQSFRLEEGQYLLEIPYSAASESRYLLVKWCLDNGALSTSQKEDPALTVSLEGILLSKE